MRQYTVILEWDSEVGSYSAVVPALRGCASMGRTVDEALANAREAIELYLEVLRDEGRPIPEDTAPQVIRIDVASPADPKAA